MIYLVVSYFTGVNNISKSEKTNLENISSEQQVENEIEKGSEVLGYQEKQEKGFREDIKQNRRCWRS